MRKVLTIVFITACIAFSAKSSLAQKARTKSAASKAAPQAKVDLGHLSGNTYTNDFFELKTEFPLGWLVGDNELEAQLVKITQGGIKTTNPRNQGAVNLALDRLTPLLGGYKSLPGTAQNSSLRIVVEHLKALPQIKSGKDYLNALLQSFKAVPTPPGFQVSEIKDETIDNISLNYVETSYAGGQKRMYVIIRKGYAVLITIESFNDADFEALHKVLTESDLHYKK